MRKNRVTADIGNGIIAYYGFNHRWYNELLHLGTFRHEELTDKVIREGLNEAFGKRDWAYQRNKSSVLGEERDKFLRGLLERAGYTDFLTFCYSLTDISGKSPFAKSLITAPNHPFIRAVIDYYRESSPIPYKYFTIKSDDFDSIEIRTNKGYQQLNKALVSRLEKVGFTPVAQEK